MTIPRLKRSVIRMMPAVFCLCAMDAAATSIVTRIHSESAGGEGLVVRIDSPASGRYPEGAPIVIYSAGGFQSDGLSQRPTGLYERGFIEIRFNFPGGGLADYVSGGTFDQRGRNSLRALRDVIQFAGGGGMDTAGRTLTDIVSPILPLSNNIGLIGWSNGGNTSICVAGIHGHEIDHLAWILNWESPVGDGMPQAEAGSKDCQLRPFNPPVNPAYDPTTGIWNLSGLAYDDQVQIPTLEDINVKVVGGAYLDMDGDGSVDRGSDFILYPLVFAIDNGYKAFYSERVRREAEQKGIFPNPPPAHVASVQMTEDFWSVRNGEYWIDSVVAKLPQVLFMVVASEIDHVQRAPDHPHVLLQYNGFLNAGARFVRLNPDRAYVEDFLGYACPQAVDNDAFRVLDHSNIWTAVEPGDAEDPFGHHVIAAAGACELADRSYHSNVSPQLESVLTTVAQPQVGPHTYMLLPNYPNPFSASTRLRFFISMGSRVSLNVYNSLGQKVIESINDFYPPGGHEIIFNGAGLASGIYLCMMMTDNRTDVRRLLVVR